jgi:ribosomal protein L29
MARSKNSLSAASLAERSAQDLVQMARDKRLELKRSQFKQAVGQMSKTHLLREMRRDVARIETVLHQQRLAQGEAR